jgi:hypothetical protein
LESVDEEFLDDDEWEDDLPDDGWDDHPDQEEASPGSLQYMEDTEQCLLLLDNLFGFTGYDPKLESKTRRVFYRVPGAFFGRFEKRISVSQEDVLLLGHILKQLCKLTELAKVEMCRALCASREIREATLKDSLKEGDSPSPSESAIASSVPIYRDRPLLILGEYSATVGSRNRDEILIPSELLTGVLSGRVDPFRNSQKGFWEEVSVRNPRLRGRIKDPDQKPSISGWFHRHWEQWDSHPNPVTPLFGEPKRSTISIPRGCSRQVQLYLALDASSLFQKTWPFGTNLGYLNGWRPRSSQALRAQAQGAFSLSRSDIDRELGELAKLRRDAAAPHRSLTGPWGKGTLSLTP